MLSRVSHPALGLGVCLDEFRTEGGKQAVRVIFDSQPDEERILLAEFVKPSTKEMPAAAKTKTAAKKKRVAKLKAEPISDELIVPYLDELASRHTEENEVVEL